MTVQVLQSRSAIDSARAELGRRKLTYITGAPLRALHRLGVVRGADVGDYLKGWDMLTTVAFMERAVPRDTPILDIGAYGSEMLCIMHRLEYAPLTGVDLNPDLGRMPFAKAIRYQVSDFMSTPYADAAFGAITAISVIEHGFRSQPLLKEMARLLKPGGHFIASFDYWPEKIDTTGIEIFGMDWRIFSRADVLEFIDQAKDYGLRPCGEIHLDAETPAILWGGKRYTFAWLALQKGA